MPNSSPARHAEMIKIGHMKTDSAEKKLLRAVEVHRAEKSEEAYFYEIEFYTKKEIELHIKNLKR